MIDDRYLPLQGLYLSNGLYNTAGVGNLAYAVGRQGGAAFVPGPGGLRVGGSTVEFDQDLYPAARLSKDAMPGLHRVEALGAGDLGYGVSYRRGTQQVSAGAHTLTFDLDHGGMITSWDRSGTEMVNVHTSKQRGIQAMLEWVDIVSGELVAHMAVQGGDRYATSSSNFRGGHVTGFASTANGDGSTTVLVDYIPIEFDPDGTDAVPGVRTYHGGGQFAPVYWHTLPMRVDITLQLRGQPDVHRVNIRAMPQWTIDSYGFDMHLSLRGAFNQSEFTRILRWDDTTQVVVPAVSDFQVTTMDKDTLFIDDTTPSTAVTYRRGLVSAGGATDGDLTVGIGNVLSSEAVGNRELGDAPQGNAWRWMRNTAGSGGPTGDNALFVGYGQWLSNRFQAGGERRRIPNKPIEVEMLVFTGTNTENQAAFLANTI